MQTTTMQARMRHPVFVLPDAMQALQALSGPMQIHRASSSRWDITRTAPQPG